MVSVLSEMKAIFIIFRLYHEMILYTWVIGGNCNNDSFNSYLNLSSHNGVLFYGLNGKTIQLLLVPHYEESLLKKKLHQVWSWAHSHISVFHLIYKGKKEKEKTQLVNSFICHSSKDYTFNEKILYLNKTNFSQIGQWAYGLSVIFTIVTTLVINTPCFFPFWPVSF